MHAQALAAVLPAGDVECVGHALHWQFDRYSLPYTRTAHTLTKASGGSIPHARTRVYLHAQRDEERCKRDINVRARFRV